MPFAVSVGQIPEAQSCREDAYAAGPARQHPTFISITAGKVHDVNVLDEILPEAGAFYVMDRGYVDFERLYIFTLSAAFFVVRTKSNVVLQRRYSHPVDKTTGVRSDHTVILTVIGSAKAYPEQLRRVSYLDVTTRKRFKFLTNNFTLPALTIALIYKSRWQVELFFKWIKQHLRIKAFYGTSENAVKTQIWIAVTVYVLVAIVRKRLELKVSLYQILQILSVTLFEKTPILQVLQPPDFRDDLLDSANQLNLFDLWPDSSDPERSARADLYAALKKAESGDYVAELEEGTAYFGTYVTLEGHFPNFAPLLDGIARRIIPALEAANFKQRFGTAFLLRKGKGDSS